MITIYGIKNCNTVKNALTWLKDNKIEYQFHDYKKEGISKQKLEQWLSQIGKEKLINKNGQTYKKLSDELKNQIKEEDSPIEIMLEKTSIIKRPIIEKNNKIEILGFDAEEYKKLFAS